VKRSNNRILSTHVGSLARPRSLLQTMKEKESGRQYDQKLFELQIREAVSEVVRKQADIGIDIVGDGEMSKVGFLNYVKDRLKGFDESDSKPLVPASWKAEIDAFPEYYEDYFKKYSNVVTPLRSLVCTGPVSYSGHADLMRDLGNLTNALKDLKVEEAFATATSPSGFGRNAYYATEEQYLYAVADALREEYTAIIKAGFVLQIDDPWLIEIVSDPTYDEKERQRAGVAHVEMLNYALRDLPEDRLRLHICYGLNHGPRTHDLPMAAVVNLMLAVNVCAYSFEAAKNGASGNRSSFQTVRF
jgi:5-methyltetrahydropteroyltriglutamate--homocysteine methyltransferase